MAASRAAYRYYGIGNIAGVIGAGQHAIAQGLDPAALEDMLDQAYSAIVEEDSVLLAAFTEHERREPSAYAPV